MTYLFGVRAEARVRVALRAGLLLAFDFDGTLAPIVEHRDHAAMPARTRRLFARLCARTACAVLTGRARQDVLWRLRPARPLHVVGAHGAEGGPPWHERPPVVAAASLRRALSHEPGIDLERAGPAIAVHYRAAPHPRHARAAALAAARALGPGSRVLEGKRVVNVLPAGAPGKGEALRYLIGASGTPGALFVGDDRTDEDAFAAVGARGVSVRVGGARRSSAEYYVRSQSEVDRLLRLLLQAVSAS